MDAKIFKVLGMLAKIEAIKITVEAMKADNYTRIQNNEALAYTGDDIEAEAGAIESIAGDLLAMAYVAENR